MRGTGSVLLEILRVQLWVVPGLAAVLAAVAALVAMWLDPGDGASPLPLEIDADSARAVLSAISGAMISFTALVFSVTMLVLQQAAAQLSPRVMRTFLRDRFNQAVLGLFVAAFVFSLLVLLGVQAEAVPQLGVLVAVILVLAAVLAFVAYIDHMAHAIRPTSVIRSIGAETRGAIDRIYPVDGPDEGREGTSTAHARTQAAEPADDGSGRVVDWPGESGYIQAFDEDELLAAAERAGRSLRLTQGVGSFLVRGSPFLQVEAAAGGPDVAGDEIAGVVLVGGERTMSQDPEFGFRQLVDIALRALSPSLNDPTTAVQVIDELHDLLRYLLERPIPSPRTLVRDGDLVVRVPAPDWDAFVHAAVDEIARAGRSMPRIAHRLTGVLLDLEGDCSPERLAALRRTRAWIDAGAPDDAGP